MRLICLSLCLTLAACAEWPDAGGPAIDRRGSDWPVLQPLSQIVAGGTVEVASNDDASRLAAHAAALRNRARILRANAGDADAMEALRARLRR